MLESIINGPLQRMAAPVLSTVTAGQSWCSVNLYNPCVIRCNGLYRMWFIGCSSHSRSNDHSLGYAESGDGVNWEPHEGNPVATPEDLPWGLNWQTPEVLYDEGAKLYRMWFTATTHVRREQTENGQSTCVEMDQALGYAESDDGVHWEVHPEPVYASGRSPSVLVGDDGSYLMWMGSRPSPAEPWDTLYTNIYRFASPDGIHWIRGERPVVCPSGVTRSCVYPCVVKAGDGYLMLHGAHVPGGKFEIFCATSPDGLGWACHHERPVLPASGIAGQFDGRYTSTPSLVCEPDRLLLYYSARPLEDEYTDGEGRTRTDKSGIYNAVGLAILPAVPCGAG